MAGTLYLVGTPIGNLEDLTLRAERTLKEADIIAAEDTRRTIKLLNHLGISKPLVSYHEHNRRESGERLLAELRAGKSVALASDAGMPVVSDPGAELVASAAAEGIPVTVIPGPCAASSALALSGMDGSRYAFEGFLPREGKQRKLALEKLKSERRTIVLYEAPHRLKKTLADLLTALGDRPVAVCNDITKFHERTDRLMLSAAAALFAAQEPRGEYALVVAGASGEPEKAPNNVPALTAPELVARYISQGMVKNEAIKQAAKDLGVRRNDVYAEVLCTDKDNNQ